MKQRVSDQVEVYEVDGTRERLRMVLRGSGVAG